ncbi:MAG: hypothetical protein WDO70_06925 [Alphaproteobacteria bacterium]
MANRSEELDELLRRQLMASVAADNALLGALRRRPPRSVGVVCQGPSSTAAYLKHDMK